MKCRFVGFKLGSFSIENKIVLSLHGKKAWMFHGDVFDITMQHSRWIAKLGAVGYDFLILLNRAINYLFKKMGKGPISMSKRIKNGVKSAIKFIGDFERTAADIAIEKEFDYVVCGHIHQPEIRNIKTGKGEVMYLNSGDWVENLTSLEYHKGKWRLYCYNEDTQMNRKEGTEVVDPLEELERKALFELLMKEFATVRSSKR